MENQKVNVELQVNLHFFTSSLLALIELVYDKSLNLINLETLDLNEDKNKSLHKSHTNFRQTCEEIKKGMSMNNKEFEHTKIIKKIYKTLSQQLDKLIKEPESDIEIFYQRNNEGKIITVIPGLDMRLVVKHLSEEELSKLWGYLYVVYISAVKVVTECNNHKKEGKTWDSVKVLEDRIKKSGVIWKDNKIFNPYIGLIGDTGCDINSLYSNIDVSNPMSTEKFLSNFGIENLLDLDKIKDQLQNIKQEDKDGAIKNIVGLLGADGDKEVTEVCSKLVEGIVDELRTNGLTSMFDTASAVSSKIAGSLDESKMRKTTAQVMNFIEKGQENLKNMTDKDGNPIDQSIMDKLKIPLHFVKSFQSMKK